MINGFFSRSPLHEHAEPAQRIRGLAELPPVSDELAQLLASDPSSEVRIAAARRCSDPGTLAAAWARETEPAVKEAVASSLGGVLAESADPRAACEILSADHLSDAIRSEVARKSQDSDRRHAAIAGMRDEEALIELALAAEHAEIRMAAAERVQSFEGLRKLAEFARDKDHGVSRLARQRIDALQERLNQSAEADAILTQLEALELKPGPILTEIVELNRRWQALDMSADAQRLARCDTARKNLQARLDREQEELKLKGRFESSLREWIAALSTRAETDALADLRTELAALRQEALQYNDAAALIELEDAEARIAQWEQDRQALAGAEALVIEAEKMVADTTIDPGTLPERWALLDRAIRTPALTQRFEAALIVVEQRRLAHVQVAQQEAAALRHRIHALLHSAEQALAGGQLREARSALDQIRPLRAGTATGTLPKPTTQRIGRLVQQLVELERWQSFGQQNARVQLIERAEAAAALPDPRQVAQEVQKLRNEWKALDEQYAGVPKALWERFNSACEKAYAPAARYFAELGAQKKLARKQREGFIAAAQAHVPTLLQEPHDLRAIERWLRETDHKWRERDLGSLEPRLWKKFDAELKTATAPLRDTLASAREAAKSARQQLIDAAVALAADAQERDVPSKVKALQAQWQEQAKALSLLQRDERTLWDQFRAACDAVFKARHSKREEEGARKQASRQALEEICAQLEQLALATDKADQDKRRTARELQDQWKQQVRGFDPALRDIEARFRRATKSVETALTARSRSRQSAVWDTLAAKERLCEDLDALVRANTDASEITTRSAAIEEQWSALPALSAAWEKKMVARRDAAIGALSDPGATRDYLARIEKGGELRREGLLELELLLGLDSPPELQAQRLALQVRQLRDRFKSSVTTGPETAGERLCDWCAQPGRIEPSDRGRSERVFAIIKRSKGK